MEWSHYDFHKREWDSLEQLRREFDWEIPDRFNAAEFLCERWARDKRRIGVFYEDRTTDEAGTYTFWELSRLSNQLANYLAGRGVERGDRVGINVPRKRETLLSYLAAWKLGAVPVPLSTLFGPSGLGYRLSDSGAVTAVVDESNAEAFREVAPGLDTLENVLLVGDAAPQRGETHFWDALRDGSRHFEVADTAAEDDVILMYTSGTTGDPKGVLHAQRAIIGHLPGTITNGLNLEVRDDDVGWSPVEYSWAGTLSFIVAMWSFGIPLLAFESGEAFEPRQAFSLIEEYEVSVGTIPPSALRMMMQVSDPAEKYDLGSMRHIVSGGEALGESIPAWAADVFGATIHEAYGQTEIWNLVAGECAALFDTRPGWMGRPLPGHEMTILDPDTGAEVEPGEVGEIAIKRDDPTVLKEYWNKPDRTEEKFHGDWALTEDLGRRDEDDWYKFVSRKDDVIISSGYRIGPEEVEDVIATHEAVTDAGVIGVPDEERGTVPKAFVAVADGYEGTADLRREVQDLVREELAAYEYPREVEFIDELPRTTTGKVRRESLREQEGVSK